MSEPLPVDVRPDVLDWMTAIGTVGATMIAALAIAYQVHDRRRRNAELISSWIVTGEEEPIEIVMHNAGTTPAYEVVARARFQGRTGAVATATTLQPGSAHVTTAWRYHPDHEDAVRPGGAEILFRDNAGRAWRRDERGKLRRVRRGYLECHEYMAACEEAGARDPELESRHEHRA